MIRSLSPRFDAVAAAPGKFRASRRAFSLAEILVVIVILILGSTIALYSYASYRKTLTVQTSASKFQRVLSLARGRAINMAVPHQVVVDLDRNTFWIDQLNAGGGITKPKVVEETAVSDFVVIESLQVGAATHTGGTRTIRFEPAGNNPFVLALMRREFDDPAFDGHFFSIRMFPSSGEAQVLPKTRL